MGDLDDLLDDIENDLNILEKKKTLNSTLKTSTNPQPCQSMEDDLDFLDDNIDVNCKATSKAEGEVPNQASKTISRCSSIYVGGSNATFGHCTMTKKRCCDHLRCTSCDFKVERFPKFRWKQDVDYLFLRNNMPDFAKILKKLVKSEASSAYACQCSWTCATNVTNLPSSLKWVCSKH